MIFECDQITAALGAKFPPNKIAENWPLIANALAGVGISSRACEIAAAATVAVETGSFSPIRERGGPGYFVKMYWEQQWKALELGNLSAEDACKFYGRGFVQITGRANYETYGKRLGLPLTADPDLALDPDTAAQVLAFYFRDHNIDKWASLGSWEKVRRRVNGGLNHWAEFIAYVRALEKVHPEPEGMAPDPSGEMV